LLKDGATVDNMLGSRIRAARTARGMSLRALAAKVGVSASMLSLLETGRSRSSVTTLHAVVEALDMSMDDLFSDRAQLSVVAAAGGEQLCLVRRDQRARVDLETGVTWEQLGSHPVLGGEFLLVSYPPGAKSSMSGKFQQHTGFEFAHVLSGELHGQVMFEEFDLAQGDSVSFDSGRPHLYENRGDTEVRGVWMLIRHQGGGAAEPGLREVHQDALEGLAAELGAQVRPANPRLR
jgi:transcriptional regulator with XRE-family HTH domain